LYRLIRVLLLSITTLILTGTAVNALDLIQQYTVSLDKKDRILGSMSGDYVVYGRPFIKVINNDGKQLFSKKLKNNVKPTVSPNGNYIGLATYTDRDPTNLRATRMDVYSSSGKYEYKINKPRATMFEIADNGRVFGIEGVPGISPTTIHIYDTGGKWLSDLTVEMFHALVVAPSGDKFIVDMAADGLGLYDGQGKLIEVLPAADHFSFDSHDDSYVGVFFQGEFHLYNNGREEKIVRSTEGSIIDLAFDIQSDLLVLLADKRIESYALGTGKMVWDFRLIENEQWFTCLDIAANGSYMLCGVDVNRGSDVPKDKRHTEGYVFVFSADGKVNARHKETYNVWGKGFPRAAFSESGNALLMATREKIKKFTIQ